MTDYFEHDYAALIEVTGIQSRQLAVRSRADVWALHELLIHPNYCAYPYENVRLLAGEEATYGNILDTLSWLREKAGYYPEASVLIYFTAPGLLDPTHDHYYLLPSDVRSLRQVPEDALRAQAFLAEVRSIPAARLLLFLDCNHIEQMEEGETLLVPSAFPAGLLEKEPGSREQEGGHPKRNRAILSSAGAGHSSFMHQDGPLSLFAYHLLEALMGHISPDEGQTGVPVSRLFDYVTREVSRSAAAQGGQQRPVSYTTGDFPIALLGGAGSGENEALPDPLELLPQPRMSSSAGPDPEELPELLSDTKGLESLLDRLGRLPKMEEEEPTLVLAEEEEELAAPDLADAKGIPQADQTGQQEGAVVQARRLEAAMPELARVQQTTELLVMVSRLDSTGLRRLLPKETVSGDIIKQEDVSEAPAEITFPDEARPVTLHVKVVVSKNDFEVDEPERVLRVYPGEDSIEETFFLNPLRSSKRAPVTIYLTDEESRRLSIIRLSIHIEEEDEQEPEVDEMIRYALAQGNVVLNYVNTGGGTFIDGNVDTDGGSFAGRDIAAGRPAAPPAAQPLELLFSPLLQQAVQSASIEAVQKVYALKEEAARRAAADDERLASLIEELTDQVPGTVETVIMLFRSSELAECAGPATQYVLKRLPRQP